MENEGKFTKQGEAARGTHRGKTSPRNPLRQTGGGGAKGFVAVQPKILKGRLQADTQEKWETNSFRLKLARAGAMLEGRQNKEQNSRLRTETETKRGRFQISAKKLILTKTPFRKDWKKTKSATKYRGTCDNL